MDSDIMSSLSVSDTGALHEVQKMRQQDCVHQIRSNEFRMPEMQTYQLSVHTKQPIQKLKHGNLL